MHELPQPTAHKGIRYIQYIKPNSQIIHVVRMDPELVSVHPVRALDNGIGRECLFTIAKRKNALAALNGGYFHIGGTLDGLSKGFVKIGKHWFAASDYDTNSLAWKQNTKESRIHRIAMVWELFIDDIQYPIDGINTALQTQFAVIYTDGFHRSTLTPQGVIELVIYDNIVQEVRRGPGNSEIPSDGFIYAITSDNAVASSEFRVGMKVNLNHRFIFFDEKQKKVDVDKDEHQFWEKADYIFSGSPLLIQNGIKASEYEQDLKPYIIFTKQPRSVVGITQKGEWIFVMVEGRQPKVAHGLTIPDVTNFMSDLGCYHALNLDGGASSIMVVENKIVNLPLFNGIDGSDEEAGQRRISDALIMVSKDHSEKV